MLRICWFRLSALPVAILREGLSIGNDRSSLGSCNAAAHRAPALRAAPSSRGAGLAFQMERPWKRAVPWLDQPKVSTPGPANRRRPEHRRRSRSLSPIRRGRTRANAFLGHRVYALRSAGRGCWTVGSQPWPMRQARVSPDNVAADASSAAAIVREKLLRLGGSVCR